MDTHIIFYINSVPFNVDTMCHTENIQSKFHFFPRTTQLVSTDCWDEIADRIFKSSTPEP